MAKQEITCDDILKELRAKQYRPVYYLMGEEPYYIDLIADYITDNILTETEKEFNLTVVYGADVDIATAKNAGLRCISVKWGFRDEEFLLEHGASDLIDEPMQLLDYLG